jgi:hypothetical protein
MRIVTYPREEIFDFVSKTSKDGVLAALDAIPTYISGNGVYIICKYRFVFNFISILLSFYIPA